tara:strand:+ start:11666 stop:11992 length:327 start_codon:yes stop_codon:yes gene_type:complete
VNDVVVTRNNAIFMGGVFTCGTGGFTLDSVTEGILDTSTLGGTGSIVVKAFNGVDNTGTLVYQQAIAEDASENINYGSGVACPDGLFVEVLESGAGNQTGTILAHWNT